MIWRISAAALDRGAIIQGSDVGGTRRFAHASGSSTATGSIDPATGGTAGTYEGAFCLAVPRASTSRS